MVDTSTNMIVLTLLFAEVSNCHCVNFVPSSFPQATDFTIKTPTAVVPEVSQLAWRDGREDILSLSIHALYDTCDHQTQ